MPKRADLKSILIIGAGPIVIGQACEFDYAGTQACKALKAEGYRIILVNSNPATIMTDPTLADATYIEPLTLPYLEAIIAKEKPDALLPTLGGQTALNCTMQLAKAGILEKYKIELIGASLVAIELAENRSHFQALMQKLGLAVPKSCKMTSLDEADAVLAEINLPVLVRASFALGGSGAGFAATKQAFLSLCTQAFAASQGQEIMIDESLVGWKEFELEVIRDQKDNCIIVCGIENVDPLGIHTGDSITVSPIQTLTDKEYQAMRQAAFTVLRGVGVDTGGSNVQFAVHPKTGKMVVIEMNPRVSRSSALASKATGYPIAKIAAKLAIGYTLDELSHEMTSGALPCAFEPSLDYVVVKIPRFNFDKFPGVANARGPQMYSVGEAMAIGRTFAESLQKALRSLELGLTGFDEEYQDLNDTQLIEAIKMKPPLQILMIAEAFRRGMQVAFIQQMTAIDTWFLAEIKQIIDVEAELKKSATLRDEDLLLAKQMGFSDVRLHKLINNLPIDRLTNMKPVYKRVDSCAGEFKTTTACLYSTYEAFCEAQPTSNKKIMIIGSGPNRIGQGIEFDYCCVQAALALRAKNIETIMVNCNPETVSTDYDVVDRLYFSPLTAEDVLNIIQIEKPDGVFLQFGGQTPLHLASALQAAGVNLLGLNVQLINQTEDRQQFQQLLHHLQLKQPPNECVTTLIEGFKAATTLGFPLIIRPSFVLGGAAMCIVDNLETLETALKEAFLASPNQPVLLETFLENAIEFDVDAIFDGEQIYIAPLLQHIESAGVHSGDSACMTPALLAQKWQAQIKKQVEKLAQFLNLRGVFNIQFAFVNEAILILEVNPRASRTLPFLCKVTGLPLVQMAIDAILGEKNLAKYCSLPKRSSSYVFVKEVVLPFNKFANSNGFLGPQMKSTGEVMGIGKGFAEAYSKAQAGAGASLPVSGFAFVDVPHALAKPLIKKLKQLQFEIITSKHLITTVDLAFVITDINQEEQHHQEKLRYMIDHRIPYATSLPAAEAMLLAIQSQQQLPISVHSLQAIHQKQFSPRHLLTGDELNPATIHDLITLACELKQERLMQKMRTDLQGFTLALLFDKPSLRTRFSFTIAMRELGGEVVESLASTRKDETPFDYAQVLSGYCHGIMVRTHADDHLIEMAKASSIPVINGLSALHHPCQILADLMTLQEIFSALKGLTLTYIGDGNNILHSLLLLAPLMGVNIHYCCPGERQPDAAILSKAQKRLTAETGIIQAFVTPLQAVEQADAVYTDVWTSMGFEEEAKEHIFTGFQVNENLMQAAKPHAIFMHCLPIARGKEVSVTLPQSQASVIYQQSENRLHLQKALLLYLLQPR